MSYRDPPDPFSATSPQIKTEKSGLGTRPALIQLYHQIRISGQTVYMHIWYCKSHIHFLKLATMITRLRELIISRNHATRKNFFTEDFRWFCIENARKSMSLEIAAVNNLSQPIYPRHQYLLCFVKASMYIIQF